MTHTHSHTEAKPFIVTAAEYLACLLAVCHSILIPLVFTACDKSTQRPVTVRFSRDLRDVWFVAFFVFLCQQISSMHAVVLLILPCNIVFVSPLLHFELMIGLTGCGKYKGVGGRLVAS